MTYALSAEYHFSHFYEVLDAYSRSELCSTGKMNSMEREIADCRRLLVGKWTHHTSTSLSEEDYHLCIRHLDALLIHGYQVLGNNFDIFEKYTIGEMMKAGEQKMWWMLEECEYLLKVMLDSSILRVSSFYSPVRVPRLINEIRRG